MNKSGFYYLRSRILQRILLGFALVIAMFGGGAVFALQQFDTLNESYGAFIESDLEVINLLANLQRSVAELKSNKRGYLLTGDAEYRRQYIRLTTVISLSQANLRALIGRNPTLLSLLAEFGAALVHYEALSQEEFASRARADRGEIPVEEVIRAFRTRQSGQVILEGESALSRLHFTKEREVEDLRRQMVEASDRSRLLAILFGVAATCCAVAYATYLARDLGGALRRLQNSIDSMARGEPVLALPMRDDEIGIVAKSFWEMHLRLDASEAELRERMLNQDRTLIDLRRAHDDLARAVRVKSDFLATMSHELRTPLNAVIGLSDLLLASRNENLSPRARQSLETMKGSGSHLLGLLDDILDLAKADAGKMTYQLGPFDPAGLARACVATMIPLIGDKPIEITFEPSEAVTAFADQNRVRQVLLNLLSNAVKFTPHGAIHVWTGRLHDRAAVRISDTGIGISDTEIPHLFEEFRQARVGDGRPYGGTGLGLALSRRLARAMGGDVIGASDPTRGSEFTLTLPMSNGQQPETTRV